MKKIGSKLIPTSIPGKKTKKTPQAKVFNQRLKAFFLNMDLEMA